MPNNDAIDIYSFVGEGNRIEFENLFSGLGFG